MDVCAGGAKHDDVYVKKINGSCRYGVKDRIIFDIFVWLYDTIFMNVFYKCCILSLLCCSYKVQARKNDLPLSLSVFNNGTALPGSGFAGVWNRSVHPGLQAGYQHTYRKRPNSSLFQTAKLGYFYHRFAQQAIQLYTEVGYEYRLAFGLYGALTAGGGYLHAFPGVEVYKMHNGNYKTGAGWGRPQAMFSTALTVGYDLERCTSVPVRPFVQYQFWMQAPFVKGYVPLLPNTALHIGIQYTFKRKNGTQHEN